ncbi:hypothetical protein M5D96_004133, partial [Drosophila gunungcola]
ISFAWATAAAAAASAAALRRSLRNQARCGHKIAYQDHTHSLSVCPMCPSRALLCVSRNRRCRRIRISSRTRAANVPGIPEPPVCSSSACQRVHCHHWKVLRVL